MELGMVGLGRMGQNMVWRLAKAGHEVVVTDMDPEVIKKTVAVQSDVATITADVRSAANKRTITAIGMTTASTSWGRYRSK